MAAYAAWGLFPIYFKLVATVAPIQVLVNRVIWSAGFLLIIISVQGRWSELRATIKNRRTVLALVVSTLMIGVNWFVFILAVAHGEILQASLGYFINPLVAVLLGVIFLRERLRRAQIAAVILAFTAVAALIWRIGELPWVALTLAFSFGFYGLVRKLVVVAPMIGLLIETLLLLPFASILMGRAVAVGVYGSLGTPMIGLLALSGIITALPLLWFASAARRLRLATLGFLQYIAPTGQFLLAVFLYGEPFTSAHAATFSLIWAGLILYSVDSLLALRRRVEPAAPVLRDL